MTQLISIIIPIYNRAHLIGETLDSVLIQTYDNWECIIVDDGSTDQTLDILNQYELNNSKFKIYSRPNFKKKGANSCRNYGVEKSNGKYLLFLDSDDILNKDCLQGRIEIFKTYPTIDFAIFSMGLFRNFKYENYNYSIITTKDRISLLELFISGPLPWNMTRPIWKKDFFIKVGIFNEKLKMFDDDEFNLRVVNNQNIQFKVIDKIDCFYRIYDENIIKYRKKEYIKDAITSHLIFLKIMNNLFNRADKENLKMAIQKNILKIMNCFLTNNYIVRWSFFYNMIYFFVKFNSKKSFKFLLILKFILLSYNKNRKGSYRLNQILDLKLKSNFN